MVSFIQSYRAHFCVLDRGAINDQVHEQGRQVQKLVDTCARHMAMTARNPHEEVTREWFNTEYGGVGMTGRNFTAN